MNTYTVLAFNAERGRVTWTAAAELTRTEFVIALLTKYGAGLIEIKCNGVVVYGKVMSQ